MALAEDLENDFKVQEGYIAFSAEVVRLALLGPAVFALFVALAGEHPTPNGLADLIRPGKCWLFAGLMFMAAAVLLGLCHRYNAVVFMEELVKKRRANMIESMKDESSGRLSEVAILLAPLCLTLGAALLFVAVFQVLSAERRPGEVDRQVPTPAGPHAYRSQ